MMNKKRLIIMIVIIAICAILGFFIAEWLTSSLLYQGKSASMMTEQVFLDTFNEKLSEENKQTSITIDKAKSENGTSFWLELEDDIQVIMSIQKDNGKLDENIVTITGIAYNHEKVSVDRVLPYLRILLKVNISDITEEEIKQWIQNADNMSDFKENDGIRISKEYKKDGIGIDKCVGSSNTIYRISRYMKS